MMTEKTTDKLLDVIKTLIERANALQANNEFKNLVLDIIEEQDIDPTTKCKKEEQGLSQQEIFKKICQEQL